MKRAAVALLAVLLYLPAVRYGFVEDDRAIIVANPAAHAVGAAVASAGKPYWPAPAEGGLYRPFTVLTYAVDWTIGSGAPGWFHLTNALLDGLVVWLVIAVLARWLPEPAALAAGIIFAIHPVHVEGVASIVSRAELLAAAGITGAVLAARRERWALAVVLSALAMLSKEHGVVAGVVVLLDDWLQSPKARPGYPKPFYASLAAVTLLFLALWWQIGRAGASDLAPPFIGAGVGARLGVALAANLRAASLLVWPANLASDYNPQVIAVPPSALAILGGALAVAAVIFAAWYCRRRAPVVTFGLVVGALAYLPTSNLIFPSGVVLAERNLYLAVLAVAALVGWAVARLSEPGRARVGITGVAVLAVAMGLRTELRLPAWRDNRAQLLTLIADHPESYRAHAGAAAVLAGIGDTAAARHEYARADSIFPRDPHLDADYAFFLIGGRDTSAAAPLVRRARAVLPRERVALRADFLLAMARGDRSRALALADTAGRWFPWEREWYLARIQ